MRLISFLAAFGLLATIFLPVAAATGDDADEIRCPDPITVGNAITCARDIAVNVVDSTVATTLCLLGVPPANYPSGLFNCVSIVQLIEP